ncbi:hypothetical protein CDSE_0452 [Candidatus Kinetoplastibacterium desouzaii TCC079E]|uniref:Transmembrane protein n=1 Tax=Candidatus Kinetoplastidibacterium desouzai TCC079E TaxID=1208919 RepID=M1LRL1_9PROT|nr:hypothetical protein [Candidatus Kinetoplastibacterium desouzaii]AGF46771.1 hypothetical protein CDSE_0452 [Candidatus Kinetoplastibacterium desouzaii TCC079E]
MTTQKIPAISGLHWIKKGLEIFRKNPTVFIKFSLIINIFTILSLKLLTIGIILKIILTPLFCFIGIVCGQSIANNDINYIKQTINVYSIKKGIKIGLLYMGICLTITILSTITLSKEINNFIGEIKSIGLNQESINNFANYLIIPIMTTTISILIFGVLLIFSTSIAVLYKNNLLKSMILSSILVWSNKKAFLVYILLWSSIYILIEILTIFTYQTFLNKLDYFIVSFTAQIIKDSFFYSSLYPVYLDVIRK